MPILLDRVTDMLMQEKRAEYRTGSGAYLFELESRWVHGSYLDILRLSKEGYEIGKLLFRPNTCIYTEDGAYTYPEFGRGGHAGINPFSFGSYYGPAIEVAEEYRNRNIGTALLSAGVTLSRKKCSPQPGKPHYFTISEVNPDAVGFFRKFGFVLYPGSWIRGEFNTDEGNIPDLTLV